MSKVKVIARIRPFLPAEVVDDFVTSDGSAISLRDSRNSAQRLIYNEFSACYDFTLGGLNKPEELFNVEIAPVLNGVYTGKTLAVLCYGVTSSGKTTTMQGSEQVPGIVAQSIETLLRGPSQAIHIAKGEYRYSMQYLEIYCDDCYDLLAHEGTSTKLSIRENKDGRVSVANLSSHQFSTMKEFEKLVNKATKSRKTAATTSNRSSSRSHAILSITVFQAPPESLSFTHLPRMLGRVEFVDLAGSERNTSSTTSFGPAPKIRMTESVSINKSLTALSRVVMSLNDNSSVIPYRDSSLTRVLKDALGGKSITILICNIAPGAKWLSHTRATIEFATKAKTIKSVPKPLNTEESKKRVEERRHVDAEFNLAVEAEVARRLAAMAALPPPAQTVPQEETAPPLQPVQDTPQTTASIPARPVSPPAPIEEPFDAAAAIQDDVYNGNGDAPYYVDDDGPVPLDEGPQVQMEAAGLPELNKDQGRVKVLEPEPEEQPIKRPSRTKKARPPSSQLPPEPSTSSSAKATLSDIREDSKGRETEESRERYRRKLNKGLKQKHEEYSNSGLPVDRWKYAKACVVAGKLALDEKDDKELAISMFEKAISWYPENERLLEETLKLKKALRDERGDTTNSGLFSATSERTPANTTRTPNPLSSFRNGNSGEDKGKRRQMFQFDVAREEALQSKPKDVDEESPKKKKSSKTSTRSGNRGAKEDNGKAKKKGKGRAVITAAAAAFADSEEEIADDDSLASEVEVEKSLEVAQPDIVSSPSPIKKKSNRKGKGRKRKSGESDEDYDDRDRKEHKVPKESPPKRRRIIF
ncbi:hypothetical protein M408DRAFT_333264 [Serendipita vermifera MAFF 305830]|uniref:Kinesin-like protein n=1 Tax=Serendipita vermifera MAFF 305830 TaxID=933852 RepID=A0A0C3ANY8_SERVB|nr:hypothetical protein M408DRAFT_333264 [Serendipita vermifera MAFF 305830]